MKNLILIAFQIFFVSNLFSSNGELTGSIMDTSINEAAMFASVQIELEGIIRSTVTNDQGIYSFDNLAPGSYLLTIQYMTKVIKVDRRIEILPDKITQANFKISSIYMTPTVTIRPELNLIDRFNPVVYELDEKELQLKPIINIVEASAGIPGVFFDEGDVYFRGARLNSSSFMIDGMKVRSPDIPKSAVKSIRTISGGVPAKYGDFTGGLILIETKSYYDF